MPTPRKYASQAERQAAYRNRRAKRDREERAAKGLPPEPVIPTLPGTRRWGAMTRQAVWLLGSMQAEMEAYYHERSESWQESERGEGFQDRLAGVETARSAVQDLDD